MTWTEFFFGEQHWHSIVGWHLAVFLAIYSGWHFSKWYHYNSRKRR